MSLSEFSMSFTLGLHYSSDYVQFIQCESNPALLVDGRIALQIIAKSEHREIISGTLLVYKDIMFQTDASFIVHDMFKTPEINVLNGSGVRMNYSGVEEVKFYGWVTFFECRFPTEKEIIEYLRRKSV